MDKNDSFDARKLRPHSGRMTSSNFPFVTTFAGAFSLLFVGCSTTMVQPPDAQVLPDANAPDASIVVSDAHVPLADAHTLPDARVLADAGPPLRGCFEGDLEIEGRSSLLRVNGIVGYEGGWIVFGQESTQATAIFLSREGHWSGRDDYAESESALTQFLVRGRSVYAFGLDSFVRFDIGEGSFSRVYDRVELERTTVGRLGDGFRVLGPLRFRGSTPRVTDIVPDDASPTGVRMITGVMPSVDFLEASVYSASVSIVEDHIQVLHAEGPSAASMRVVDVQLGAPAGGDEPVGVRVWSTTSVPWNHALITATSDASRWVGTTRATLETERVVEVVGRDRSWPLLRGVVLRGWEETAGRYVVLTDDAMHVFRGFDVAPLGEAVTFAPAEDAEWPTLAVMGEFAATAFERSRDAAGPRFAVRCMQLPTL